jgi:DNA-binding CsgD family transcriptional regulator/tetratricopeptide (TPR) repeat protein
VPSLAVPDLHALPAADEMGRCSEVRLFVERAGFARPEFALTAANAAAVAEVCRRLDGIPLAIELAAARAAALSVEQIAARLDDCCRLLTDGSRTALPRHRTLRATLDWSHDLLTEVEQNLFRRLAVFAGGWTLAAAEAVGAWGEVAREEVLDGLARLVAKSLAQMEERDGEARYRLLEPVRQYAAERLAEAGEEDAARDRHAAWCLALAERAEPELWADDHARWLDRLEAEHDNLRAALTWWADRDPAVGLRLASLLYPFWKMHVHPTEGRRWLALLLARAPDRDATRAWALIGAAGLARFQGDRAGDLAAARAWGEEGLALGRRLGDRRLIADALGELGAVCILQGDHGRAGELLAEGEAISRVDGFRRGLGVSLYYLGRIAQGRGDYRRARELMEEGLAQGPAAGAIYQAGVGLLGLGRVALYQGDVARAEALGEASLAQARRAGGLATAAMALRALGQAAAWRGDLERADRRYRESLDLARSVDYAAGIAPALAGLGRVAYLRGEPARALAWLEESLTRSRAGGSTGDVGAALHGLGLAAWGLGDAERADEHLRASLALRRETGDRLCVAECLEGLAQVAAGIGSAERAARLLGAAEALREAMGAPAPPVERPSHEQAARAARDALGGAAFAAAWAAGRALGLEQAVAEALADDEARPPAPAPTARAGAPSSAAADGLTPRELEVLRLLAAGRSNRQMAAELSVSARTIERHIGNLYTKIDAHNRADATAFAFRRGLM